MDYKRVKSGREKGLVWLALILTAVILVQCVINIVLIVSNRQTKAMEEMSAYPLKAFLEMGLKVTLNTENTDNAENSENTADFENSAEENGNQ